MSCTELVKLIGSSSDENKRFFEFLGFAIGKMKDAGSHAIAVAWIQHDQLFHNSVDETSWEEPDIEYWEIQEYRKEFSCEPATKGHKTVDRMNKQGQWEKCVIVPGRKVYKLKQRSIEQAVIHRKVADASFEVGEGQLAANYADLAATFTAGLESATGMSLDDMLSARVMTQHQTGSSSSVLAAVEIPDVKEDPELPASRFRGRLSVSTRAAPSAALAAQGAPDIADTIGKTKGGLPKGGRAKAGAASAGPSGVASTPCKGAKRTADLSAETSDAKKRAGRPKEDGYSRAQRMLVEFENVCDGDRRWFGDLHVNQDRTVSRVLQDLRLLVDEEKENKQVFEAMEITHKRLSAAQSLCRAYKHSGPNSQGLYDSHKDLQRFLSMTPVATEPWPTFLKKDFHETEAMHAAAPHFWKLVGFSQLVFVEVQEPAVLARVQLNLIVEKVMKLTQAIHMKDAVVALHQFCETVPADLPGVVLGSLRTLRVIVDLEAHGRSFEEHSEQLSQALDVRNDPIVNALSNFPYGRALREQAIAKLGTLRQYMMKIAGFVQLCSRIPQLYTDSTAMLQLQDLVAAAESLPKVCGTFEPFQFC